MKNVFYDEGFYYKGNTHSHTNRSDGHLTPDELVSVYKRKGYNFLAITEHNLFTEFTLYDTDDFVLLSGMEMTIPAKKGSVQEYHAIVLQGSKKQHAEAKLPKYIHNQEIAPKASDTQEQLQDTLNDAYLRGYNLILAHPYWSRLEPNQISKIRNITGLEVFNNCSDVLENVGESTVYWDCSLNDGSKLWGFAADDNHNFFPYGSSGCDSFGAYIIVKAKSLSNEDIIQAITDGSFYSSCGPEIYEFFVDDGIVNFQCSPVSRIYLKGHKRQNQNKIVEKGESLIAEFISPLFGDEMYIRAECYDEHGRKAYTNPIWLNG